MTDRTSPETAQKLAAVIEATLNGGNNVELGDKAWRFVIDVLRTSGHAQTAQQPDAGPVAATVLELLSPSNLPMENDPDVLQVARAIAERGIGRYWDDFPETDAFDTDQGDLIEYARAAVEIFRKSARPVDVAQRPIEPVLNSLMYAVLDHPGTSKEAKIELRAKLRSIIAPLYASDTSTVRQCACLRPGGDPLGNCEECSPPDSERCTECGWGGGGIRDEGCLISPCPRHTPTQAVPNNLTRALALLAEGELDLNPLGRNKWKKLVAEFLSSVSSPDRPKD